MGVDRAVILGLQQDMILHLIESLTNNEMAMRLLLHNSQLSLDYKEFAQSGIQLVAEPFFRSMIRAIIQKSVSLLKTKARIQIPPEYGRTMFGVLDETDSLKYQQVFVQYTEDINGGNISDRTAILKGTVLITKNPCTHPGDVRKFEAVDVEKLHHIRDCVVFPAKGPRPHPDEMAGSDLDGDEYTVVWMPELIFSRDNERPMLFPVSTAPSLNRAVTVEDMVEFFCDFIQADCVGQVAHAHLAWADVLGETGIFEPQCIQLAGKLAMALDFAKTGTSVTLKSKERPWIYPDFMEKSGTKITYLSDMVLGELYRNIRCLQLTVESTTDEEVYSPDPDLVCPGWENYQMSAHATLAEYNQMMLATMRLRGIESEGEVVTGAFNKYSKYMQEMNDTTDLLLVIERQVQHTFRTFRAKFFREFENTCDTGDITERQSQKASAWYLVSHSQPKGQVSTFGLPWTVSDVLLAMKARKNLCGPAVSTFIKQIDDSLHKVLCAVPNFNSLLMEEMACAALMNWVSHYSSFIIVPGFSGCSFSTSPKQFVNKIFDQVLDHAEYERCSSNTQCTLILKCLQAMVRNMFAIKTRPDAILFAQQHRIGQLALITLYKLSQSGNVKYLGFECDGEQPEATLFHQEETEVLRIPLYEKISPSNVCFNRKVVHQEEEVLQLLRAWTGTSNIEMRLDSKGEKQWYILMTAKGNRWALEQLKTLVTQRWFRTAVSLGRLPRNILKE